MTRHAATAVVSGSFDPITKGHLYVIDQALKMVDHVIVMIANNPDKRYHFNLEERQAIVLAALKENDDGQAVAEGRISIVAMPHGQFTARSAKEKGATLIVRGLRNVVDFEYEHSQQLINTTIEPDVTTVFVMPPTDLIAVSSSNIKAMVGIEGWEELAENYIPLAALNALRKKA